MACAGSLSMDPDDLAEPSAEAVTEGERGGGEGEGNEGGK